MPRLAKRAEARVTYAVGWGRRAARGGGITASGWTVEPREPGGLAITDAAIDDAGARATLIGGRPGATYRVRNTVSLADGGEASRELAIEVAR